MCRALYQKGGLRDEWKYENQIGSNPGFTRVIYAYDLALFRIWIRAKIGFAHKYPNDAIGSVARDNTSL
jgi:hypothetical protein